MSSIAKIRRVSFSKFYLIVELDDRRKISVPLDWYPRLKHATQPERKNWQIIGEGMGIHWPDLDEDISLDGLLTGKRSTESLASLKRWLDLRNVKRSGEIS
ncbi:MAG: DUF2442 domain-containing protein [Bacteroidetes bacterium]|nr:MAG: DUF2442 domain-containing protein [Bacteroidota bacterium]